MAAICSSRARRSKNSRFSVSAASSGLGMSYLVRALRRPGGGTTAGLEHVVVALAVCMPSGKRGLKSDALASLPKGMVRSRAGLAKIVKQFLGLDRFDGEALGFVNQVHVFSQIIVLATLVVWLGAEHQELGIDREFAGDRAVIF